MHSQILIHIIYISSSSCHLGNTYQCQMELKTGQVCLSLQSPSDHQVLFQVGSVCCQPNVLAPRSSDHLRVRMTGLDCCPIAPRFHIKSNNINLDLLNITLQKYQLINIQSYNLLQNGNLPTLSSKQNNYDNLRQNLQNNFPIQCRVKLCK